MPKQEIKNQVYIRPSDKVWIGNPLQPLTLGTYTQCTEKIDATSQKRQITFSGPQSNESSTYNPLRTSLFLEHRCVPDFLLTDSFIGDFSQQHWYILESVKQKSPDSFFPQLFKHPFNSVKKNVLEILKLLQRPPSCNADNHFISAAKIREPGNTKLFIEHNGRRDTYKFNCLIGLINNTAAQTVTVCWHSAQSRLQRRKYHHTDITKVDAL